MADDKPEFKPHTLAGRPSKFDPRFCDELIRHMQLGYSFEAFAGRIGTCKQTIYNWLKEHVEFLDAKKIGEEACRFYWEGVGLRGTNGLIENFNAGVWIFNMKNRFRWQDRHEVGLSLPPSPEMLLMEQILKLTPEQRRERYEQIMHTERLYLKAREACDKADGKVVDVEPSPDTE